MLKDRQKSILEAVVREHTRTARPVSSQELLEEFDISPATIRNEMLRLDELGYLEQPHTSAGRVPTDKGYRFFVDNLVEEFFLSKGDKQMLNRMFSIDETEEFIKNFSKALVHVSGIFAAVGLSNGPVFYEAGFSELLETPEFSDLEHMRKISRLIDSLDAEAREIFDETDEEGKIFIGRENPWEEARSCATFLSSWQHPQGFEGFFVLIGPKRTDYQKHKAIIRTIHNHQTKQK